MRGAGGGIGHGRSAPSANVLPQAHGDGATLGWSWMELHIARRRHLSVAPPADRMSSSSSPTRCARRRCAGLDDRLGSSEVCCSTPWLPCRQGIVPVSNKASYKYNPDSREALALVHHTPLTLGGLDMTHTCLIHVVRALEGHETELGALTPPSANVGDITF